MTDGLDGRSRDENGRIRQKRGDTHVGTIEQRYGVDFGVRTDMELETLRQRTGLNSIDDLIRFARERE
jgi:hypothetical protein